MIHSLSVLLVDDDEGDYILMSEYLHGIEGQTFEIMWAATYHEALALLEREIFDLCFFDYLLGIHTGLDLLRVANELRVRTPIILLTGKSDVTVDMQAMRFGVSDYLEKRDLDAKKLERSIRYALERTAAHKALRESEEKYRAIFESSLDAIYLLDAEGCITDVNESATHFLGFSREDFLKIKLPDLFHEDTARDLFFEKIKRGKNIQDFETELVAADGSSRFCVIVCSGLSSPADPETIFFQVILHDITRRKKTEQELLTAEKSAATGRFMRMLGHEIRNPLTNIDLAVGQLATENQDPELHDFIEIISRNSQRIGQLVTALLQTTNHPTQPQLQAGALVELINHSLEMAKDRMALKNIRVEKNYDPQIGALPMDVDKLSIALLNIIINAVEVMEAGRGVLRISTRRENHMVAISICDNGPGIPRETQPYIFEPYYSRKPGGLGLGLASTWSIVQSHGGRIEVQSQPNQGAEFVVWLPA